MHHSSMKPVPHVEWTSFREKLGASAPACVASETLFSHASVISSEKTALPTSHASGATPGASAAANGPAGWSATGAAATRANRAGGGRSCGRGSGSAAR